MSLDNVPEELQALTRWVAWTPKLTDDGKVTKIPRIATTAPGGHASTTDPNTWRSFDEAKRALSWAAGVGFVFADGDDYVGVDLDDCLVDGAIHPDARVLLDELDGYTEVSPSGAGVHVIVRGSLNGGRNRTYETPWGGAFEVYARGRYFTMSGTPATAEHEWTLIPRRQRELDRVVGRMLPTVAPATTTSTSTPLTDVEVIEKASAAANGSKFDALFRGDALGYESASEADLALVSILAFYTQDRDQLLSLVRRSGRWREKWLREDYAARTIGKALEGGGETYSSTPAAAHGDVTASTAAGSMSSRLPVVNMKEALADMPPEPDWVWSGYAAAYGRCSRPCRSRARRR
jgi:putative DNA primase/helicase